MPPGGKQSNKVIPQLQKVKKVRAMSCESNYVRRRLRTSDKLVQLLRTSGDGQDFLALNAVLQTSDERGIVELGCCFLELLDLGLLS